MFKIKNPAFGTALLGKKKNPRKEFRNWDSKIAKNKESEKKNPGNWTGIFFCSKKWIQKKESVNSGGDFLVQKNGSINSDFGRGKNGSKKWIRKMDP